MNTPCWGFYYEQSEERCDFCIYRGEGQDFWHTNTDCMLGENHTVDINVTMDMTVDLYIRNIFNIIPYKGRHIILIHAI